MAEKMESRFHNIIHFAARAIGDAFWSAHSHTDFSSVFHRCSESESESESGFIAK